MATRDTRGAIDAIWRIESVRLIAGLTRFTGDIGLAEDLAQDALVAALEKWPEQGIPENPGAWLMTTAKNRGVDAARHIAMARSKHEELGRAIESRTADDAFDNSLDDHVEDDLLALIFMTCHPLLSRDAQLALTLRLFGGLTTTEIARAFLAPEATIAQRISRAKQTLKRGQVDFAVPTRDELGERQAAVLEVIYLIFNEGYAATSGDEWMRPALCDEALRIGRMLAELEPLEAEVHGLVALMELQASRLRTRTDADGAPVLLLDQDRSRWDWMLVGRGLTALERAQALKTTQGPYCLQAAIAACHARARKPEDTDWERIAALYGVLAEIMPSPVVELNRAVAIGMAFGPTAGLEIADRLMEEQSLADYHLLPAVRGDLLDKLGRTAEARAEFERAATLTRNAREQAVLRQRATVAAQR